MDSALRYTSRIGDLGTGSFMAVYTIHSLYGNYDIGRLCEMKIY